MTTVLLNPRAGGEKDRLLPARIAQLFGAFDVEARVVPLDAAVDTSSIVRAASAAGDGIVVAAGGDGTVSSVGALLAGTSTALGVLPLGTLNHFAKDVGIPLKLEAAVATIAAGRAVRVDVAEVNGRVFLNNSSIGIYPNIVVERESLRQQGYRKWTAFALATTRLLRRYRGVRVTLSDDAATVPARTPFVVVGNNEYHVDGLRLGGRARLDGGLLSAYLAPRLQARQLPRLVALALVGRARSADTLAAFATPALTVDTPHSHRIRVALDGEVVVMRTPLRYRVRPRDLSVIVPPA